MSAGPAPEQGQVSQARHSEAIQARPPRHARSGAPRVVALASLAFTLAASAAFPNAGFGATPACEEEKGAAAADGAENLIELQPNSGRPTFHIPVDDEAGAVDDISFLPKGRRRVGSDAEVTAEIIDWPRTSSRRIDADLRVAAQADGSGTRVILNACIDRRGRFGAGRFEGTVSIYGPTLSDFTYPLIVTTKWPWWVAVALLGGVIGVFLFLALITGSLTFGFDGWRRLGASLLGTVFAVGAAVPPYYATFWKNDTWGSDPGAQMFALVVAGFTAAAGGLAAAQRLLRK